MATFLIVLWIVGWIISIPFNLRWYKREFGTVTNGDVIMSIFMCSVFWWFIFIFMLFEYISLNDWFNKSIK